MSANPVTPDYTKSKPVLNENCVGKHPGVAVFPIGDGKTVNLYPDTNNVEITTERESTHDDFYIGVPIYTEPTISLSLDNPSGVRIKGSTVDTVELSWSYNKAMQSQKIYKDDVEMVGVSISNDGGNSYSVTLNSQGLTMDTDFKVEGNDGVKTVSATKTVKFGNYLIWHETANEYDSGTSKTTLATMLEGGTNIGPLTSRSYGSPFIQPQSTDPNTFFYIGIASEYDDTNVDVLDKFYEHDGEDKGGGMFLIKEDVLVNNGQASVNYNVYRALFGAQGGAKYEVI